VTLEDLAGRLDVIDAKLDYLTEDVSWELKHLKRLVNIQIGLLRRLVGMTPEDVAALEKQMKDQAEELKRSAKPPQP
jgi:hypothetical protein